MEQDTTVERETAPSMPVRIPLRSSLLGAVPGFLAASLVITMLNQGVLQPQAAPLLEGGKAIRILAMGACIGTITFFVMSTLSRRKWISILISFLVGAIVAPLAVPSWLCLLPVIVALGFLLLAPRIRTASKQKRTVLLISYIIFVEFTVVVTLLRPEFFTLRTPLWASFPVVLLAIAFPLRIAYLRRRRDIVLATWPLTTANILSVNIEVYYGSESTSTMQAVVLQYPAGNELISSEQKINIEHEILKPGDVIKIRYDPNRPDSLILDHDVCASLEDALILFPLLIWGILIFVFVLD